MDNRRLLNTANNNLSADSSPDNEQQPSPSPGTRHKEVSSLVKEVEI